MDGGLASRSIGIIAALYQRPDRDFVSLEIREHDGLQLFLLRLPSADQFKVPTFV